MPKSRESKSTHSTPPAFADEDAEAQWWASVDGRTFLKKKAALNEKHKGSRLVANLNATKTVQIAIRLPAPDLARAREIADQKGIGYQTLLKMLVHEGLEREARRR